MVESKSWPDACVCLFVCCVKRSKMRHTELCGTAQRFAHQKPKQYFALFSLAEKKSIKLVTFISLCFDHTHTHTVLALFASYILSCFTLIFVGIFLGHCSLARSLFFTTSFGNCLIYCCNSNGCLNAAYKTIENRKHNIWSKVKFAEGTKFECTVVATNQSTSTTKKNVQIWRMTERQRGKWSAVLIDIVIPQCTRT